MYVSNGRGGTVTPIATATNTRGRRSRSAWRRTDRGHPGWEDRLRRQRWSVVVPIATATSTPGAPIRVGVTRPGLHDQPDAIVITPDGKTVYVANIGSGTVTPIDDGHEHAGRADRGRRAAPGDRDHAGRQDRLCRQSEQAAAPALAQL